MSKRELPDSQIVEAQQLRNSGLSVRVVGKKFGVSQSTMARYLDPNLREREKNQCKQHHIAKYVSDPEYRKHAKEYSRQYRLTHKAYYASLRARDQKNNPGYYNAHNAMRRALVLGVTVGNLAEVKEIYRCAKEDPKVRCYLCGKLIPKGHRHVDHIVPLSKGGQHRPSNLAVACDACNTKKKDKLPRTIGVLL